MACPPEGRVVIPPGKYRVTSLFLKSNSNLELEEGAVLIYLSLIHILVGD